MNFQVFATISHIISLNIIVKVAMSVVFLLLLTPTFCDIIRDKNGEYYAEFIVVNDGRLANVLSYYENIDKRGCVIKCLYDVRCKTVNFNFKEGKCETCDTDFDIRDAYIHDPRWLNFGTPTKVDGGWSKWTVTPCSASCGGGHKGKYRDCTDPEPRHGGDYCKGKNFARVSCNQQNCPVDGEYGLWGAWTACDITCGNGTQERTRLCDSPIPAHNGKTCVGAYNELKNCTANIPCPVARYTYKIIRSKTCSTSGMFNLSLAECEEYSRLYGYTWRGTLDTSYWPRGCYRYWHRFKEQYLIRFNTNVNTIELCDQGPCVCKISTAYKYLSNETALVNNTLVATIPKLYLDYLVSFEVFITAYNLNYEYVNILHVTTGGNNVVYGSRSPAVWIKTKDHFYICSAVNGKVKAGYCYENSKVSLNQWIRVRVRQYYTNGDWTYSIHIDGKTVHNVTNSQPQEFDNVKIYASNPWNPSASGMIRNLDIYTERDPCVKVDQYAAGGVYSEQNNVPSWFACSESCKASPKCEAWYYIPSSKVCRCRESFTAFKGSMVAIAGKRDCPR